MIAFSQSHFPITCRLVATETNQAGTMFYQISQANFVPEDLRFIDQNY